jgi:hypothetical protein
MDGVIKVGDQLPAFALKNAFRASGQRAVGSDGVPRQLVTLLRRRAVCFAARSEYP